ncbi:MAG: hypothetical protein JWO68_2262 [Actinomycetia bacterium]|nr:hypothetical protein [Actinomycetes bacterium]
MDPDEITIEHPQPPAIFAVDPGWAPRLVVVGAAAAATVGLILAGAVVTTLTVDIGGSGFTSDLVRHQRLHYLLQVANAEVATLVLVAGLAVAAARHLGDRRRWPRLAAFGAASAIAALALIGAITDLVWDDHLGSLDNTGSALLGRAAALGLALVGGWLSDAWLTDGPDEVMAT